MAEDILATRSPFGRTFIAAMWILGAIAAFQVFAVGWAVVTRPQPAIEIAAIPRPALPVTPASATETPPASIPVPNGIPSIPGSTQEFPPGMQPKKEEPAMLKPAIPAPPGFNQGPATFNQGILPAPSLGGPDGGAASSPLGTALADAAMAKHPAHGISDPLIARMVATGEELRGAGNMLGALKALRDAEAIIPDHPRVLSELAGTFSQMAQEDKALEYWERVYKLGPQGAGAYYDLADMALKGNQASASGTTRSVLKIGDVKVTQDPVGEDGEKVTLRVSVEGDPAIRPSGAEMALLVYFYDKVNGKAIEASTADTSERYPTQPYDWQGGGVEDIEVIYHQPVFTTEQARELGKRIYHGYVIELYYRDQLQDTTASPVELLELGGEAAPPAPKQGDVRAPDSSLFPTIPE